MSDLLCFGLLFISKCNWASRLARASSSHTKLLLLHFVKEFEVGLDKFSSIDLLATVIGHDILEHCLSFDNFNRLLAFLRGGHLW